MRPHRYSNDDLDARVLRLLAGGSAVASEIVYELGGEPGALDMHAIDRALQRLRKRGQIVFDRQSRRWNKRCEG